MVSSTRKKTVVAKPWYRSMVTVTQSAPDDIPTVEKTIVTEQHAAPTTPVVGQPLRITENCWKRVAKLSTDDNSFLRVFVDAGGCSGFTYQFEMDTNLEADDVCYTNNSLRVVVDRSTLELIQGSKLDYVEEMIKSSFEISENPQSESACGCGSSFAVKNFAANPATD